MKKCLPWLFCLALPFMSAAQQQQEEKTSTLPVDSLRDFVEVYQLIRDNYVEEKSGQELIKHAITGMLQGLDPYSVYIDSDDLKDFDEEVTGHYFGFGFGYSVEEGKIIITAAITDSPAEKAGLKTGDQIIKINGTLLENMPIEMFDKILLSEDSVTLTVLQKRQTKTITLKKSQVSSPSVVATVYEKQYGYVRISQFQDATKAQFEAAIKELLDEKIKGLVIDLRNNPGGYVHSATEIADLFLSKGLIASTKNLNKGREEKIHAHDMVLVPENLPVVVVINAGSASASELLAGALKDQQRAVVVGTQSFGKGSVQSLLNLNSGSMLKLTSARYYTPNGESIQARGITPDIEIEQWEVAEKVRDDWAYHESELLHHLPEQTTDNTNKTDKTDKADKTDKTDNSSTDELSLKTEANEVQATEATPETTSHQENVADKPNKAEKTTAGSNKPLNILVKVDLQLYEAFNVLKTLMLRQNNGS